MLIYVDNVDLCWFSKFIVFRVSGCPPCQGLANSITGTYDLDGFWITTTGGGVYENGDPEIVYPPTWWGSKNHPSHRFLLVNFPLLLLLACYLHALTCPGMPGGSAPPPHYWFSVHQYIRNNQQIRKSELKKTKTIRPSHAVAETRWRICASSNSIPKHTS